MTWPGLPAAAGGLLAGAGGAIRTLTLFFLLWHPLSDVWWLPTNRHRLQTNRHRLHTNRHRLHTNRHRLHTNRHRLPSYTPTAIGYPPTAIGYTPMAIGYPPTAIGYPPAAIVGRIGHSEFFFLFITAPPERKSRWRTAQKFRICSSRFYFQSETVLLWIVVPLYFGYFGPRRRTTISMIKIREVGVCALHILRR